MTGRVGVTLGGFAAALLTVAIAAAPALGQPGQPQQPVQPQQSGQLDPPSGLKATAVSGTEVDLSWSAPDGPPPSLYNVYQGTSSGGESKTSLSSNDTSADVIGLSPGTAYYFEVTAVDDRGNESDPSNEAQATTQGGISVVTTAVSTPVSTTPVSTTPVSTTPVSPSPVSPPPVSPGPPASGGGRPSWRVFLPPVVVAGAVGGLVPVVRRRRRRRRAAPLATPANSPPAAGSAVRAVPRPGPQAAVTVHSTGPGVTQAVRFVPNPGTLTTTIEKVQPR